MDPKGPSTALCLHRETRVNLEPLCPNSVIHIQLPSTSTFNRTSRQQRQILNYVLPCKDEEAFTRQHVASFASVYFRKSKKYPRSILWRCLEENRVLELRSVDLSKGEHENKEATLILRLGFPTAIRHGGVALADPVGQDLLHVFVLTKANELYTFALRPDLFCRLAASDDEIGRGCKIYRPASFSISNPHRLYACSSLELLVSLGDGRLVRLKRKMGEDGSVWDEAAYNDGNWGSSLRGLIRWQGSNTVRYDGDTLDQNTAVAAALSPDDKHLYVVCLNHTIKAWNLDTGKVGFCRDLQNKQREPQEISKLMLDPGLSQVLQTFEAAGAWEGDQYYVVTFSPQDSGIFKFWAVRDADYAHSGVRDLFPEDVLRLPDPEDGGLWTFEDFKLKGTPGGMGMEIWILIRLNRRYKLYHRQFDLLDLPLAWQRDWTTTATDAFDEQPPSESSVNDPEDPTEKWLDYIFSPGRVPLAVLETALSIYCQGRNVHALATAENSLHERIASAVGSQVHLKQVDHGNVDFLRFRAAINDEWNSFWTYVTDLGHSRWDPLRLAYDDHANMPWIAFADGCSAIRDCSHMETITKNRPQNINKNINLMQRRSIEDGNDKSKGQLPDELAMLIEAAAGFQNGFSPSLRQSCKNVLKNELWQDSSYSVPVRIQTFYDRCNFAEEVGDKQYNKLVVALSDLGGFDGLDTASFQAIVQSFPQLMSSEATGLVSTKFGLKVLVKGAQQLITLHTRILTDLLLLTVFLDMEVDREETSMRNFDSARVYMGLLDVLRQYQMMEWLATTACAEPTKTKESAGVGKTGKLDQLWMSTILENLFAIDTKPQTFQYQPQTSALSNSIQDLLKWTTGGNDPDLTLDQVLVHIQCNLLKNGNIDLAMDFRQFQPSTAWATYIRGRLCLTSGDLTEAAIYFKKAAFNLSRPQSMNYHDAAGGLLNELEASFLGAGLPNYYSHILSLFETAHAYSYVSSFAQLALQFTPPAQNHDLHTDLLSRLFYASLKTSDFQPAYSALTRYTDSALQKSALTSLVTTMVSQGASKQLLSFPFPTLRSAVDAILAEQSHHTIDSVAPIQGKIPYYKVLYAWRLKHGDFRGAAAVLMERLERMKVKKEKGRGSEKDGLLDEYLLLINALAVVGEGQGWVFVGGGGDGVEGGDGMNGRGLQGDSRMKMAMQQGGKNHVAGMGMGKRRVVTLEDVRRGYQEELDRRSVLESGRFGIVARGGGEDGDADGDDDEMDIL